MGEVHGPVTIKHPKSSNIFQGSPRVPFWSLPARYPTPPPLFRNRRRVHLTAKVYTLLRILIERRGQVVSKEELIRRLWPDSVGTEANLTVNVAALRKALGEKRGEHRYVVTLPSRGYSFVAEVETLPAPRADSPSGPLRIAVLPPRLEAPTDDQVHLPTGLAVGLSGRLIEYRGVEVRPSSATLDPSFDRLSPGEIARRLKVDLLVRGEFIRRETTFDLHLELVEPETGGIRWSETFEDVLQSLPFTVAEAVGKLGAVLHLEPISPPVTYRPRNPRAYNLYLEGRYHLSRFHPVSLARAKECFQHSLELEREAPCTWTSLGLVYLYLIYFGQVAPREGFARSEEAAKIALDLEPRAAVAYALLGNVHRHADWDWEKARRDHELSVEFGPGNSFVHEHMGYHLVAEGRFEEGIAELERALELDPTSLNLLCSLSWSHRLQRRIGPARELVETALRMDPGFLLAHYHAACNDFAQERYHEALDRLLAHEDDASTNSYLHALIGHAYGGLGDTAGVERALARIERDDRMRSTRALHSAIALAGFGDARRCISLLEIAAEERHGFVAYLDHEPLWDKVRGHSRFQDLARKIRPRSEQARN